MRKKQLLSFLLSLMCASFCIAQVGKVKGKIISAKDNMPVAKATVATSGSSVAAADDGSFTISLSTDKATLTISATGYVTKEISVNNNDENIIIKLDDNVKELTDVVVTALGVKRQAKSLTYSVQSIKPKEIIEVRDPDVVNTLQGKVAGALIQQGSGGLGSATSIVLRGGRSISGNSAALFVVDGVPIDNFTLSAVGSDFGNGYTGANGTTTINPDDIESMTILRGASASALYGSAAANGVVVITTKKGKEGKLSVDINSGVSRQSVWQLVPFQNTYGQGIGGVLNADVGTSWGAKMTGQTFTNHLGNQDTYKAQPDNVKDFFNNGFTFNNAIGITSGTAKTQTYFSYSNSIGKGMLPLNTIGRHIVNLRINNQLTEKLSVDAKVNYVNEKLDHTPVAGENNSPIFDAYQIPRSMGIDVAKNYQTIDATTGIEAPNVWPSTLNSIYQNPYWAINGMHIAQTIDKITGFVTAKHQAFPWLAFQGRANIEKSFTGNEQRFKDGVLLYSLLAGGTFNKNSSTATTQWYDFMMSGNRKINNSFSVDYQAGGIFNDYINTNIYGAAQGLIIPNTFSLSLGSVKNSSNGYYHVRSTALFAQSTLSFKEKIFLDASFRNDWTTTLPANNRSYPYGSIGISSIISDLITLPEVISFFKINASAARVGNGAGAYQLSNNYFASTLPLLGVGYLTRDNTLALENLKPELTDSYEGTIDLRFLKNNLGFEFTVYKSNSFNQILTIALPPASGFAYQRINAGNIANKGIELLVNANVVNNKNFKWNIAFNGSKNVNKVVALTETSKREDGYIRMSGVSLIEGRPFGEVYAQGWERNEKGNNLLTNDGVPLITTEAKYIGNLNPKALLGLTNTFTYKNFSLRILINGRIGGIAVSGNEGNLAFSGITKATEQFREGGWVLTGQDTAGLANTKSINAQSFWTTVSGQRSGAGEFFSYNATNFRIREASLAYNFSFNHSKIKSLRASIFASNLLWLYRGKSLLDIPGLATRKLPFDPDMTLGGYSNGSDYGVFPASRNIGFNVQLSF
jgi:TonB-linked SusC/RagA family outer membrane protein